MPELCVCLCVREREIVCCSVSMCVPSVECDFAGGMGKGTGVQDITV